MNHNRILLAGLFAILIAVGGVAAIRAQADSTNPPPNQTQNKSGTGIGDVRLGF
jgi:hypothetical protein